MRASRAAPSKIGITKRGSTAFITRVMRGSQPFFRLERGLEAVLGELPPAREVSLENVLQEYGSGTTREFSEVLELDEEATATALQKAGARRRPLAGSYLWSLE